MFGHTSSDILGRNVSELIPQSARIAHHDYIVNADQHAEKIANKPRELKGLKKDGSVFFLELNLSRMQQNGQQMFLAIIRDISDRKALETQNQRLVTATQLMSESVLIMDADGIIKNMNPATETLFGYSHDELVGQHTSFLLGEEKGKPLRKIIVETFSGEGHFLGEVSCRRKDGVERIIEISATPIRDVNGNITGNVGVNRDITESKAERQELDAARIRAEETSQSKSLFLSSMSHELRTPLNSVIGFSDVLLLDEDEPLTLDQIDSVNHISRAGHHLLDLVNDILDLSNIETGNLKLYQQDVPVRPLLEECVGLLAPLAAKSSIDVSCQGADDIILNADYRRLKQIVINLLSNAIKYNNPSGTVCIEVASADANISISVSDNGPGIPEEHYHELFQPFNRLGAESQDIEGAGIGLVVTKELVERMGGSIEVLSRPGEGATFTVLLPQSETEG